MNLISKFKAFVLFFVLLVCFVPAATAQDFSGKISPDLLEAMNKAGESDLFDVYLWLTTIDRKAVDEEVEKLTGFTENSFEVDNEEFDLLADLIMGDNDDEDENKAERRREARERFQQNARERERRSQNVDRFITERRRIASREYNNMHRSFGRNHLSNIEVVFQSQLTPMAVIKATRADIMRLARVDNVQSLGLYVEEEYVNNSEEHWLVTDLAISLPNAGADYTRNVMGLRGEDIRIGQFENGIAPREGLLAHVPMTHIGSGLPGANDHAYTVAIVMLSKAGVVPNASLVRGVNQVPTTVRNEGWEAAVLPPHSVHLINQSSALLGQPHAHYTANARWLDYMVANHHVMFVMSTGNENSPTARRMVGNPATAYNILAVGSHWHNNTVSHHDDRFSEFTNHGTSFGLIKPDVLAPGGGGTSYASPYVAGVVAQMLQHIPELRTQAHAVKARILASTDRKVLRGDGQPDVGEVMGQMTPRQGAGVINAVNAVNFGHYAGTLAANANHYEIRIPVQAGDTTQIALSWFMNISATGSTPQDPSSLLTNLDLEVYNSSGTMVGSSRHRINNNQIVRFRSTAGGEYRVRVVRHSQNNTVERFALAFPRVATTDPIPVVFDLDGGAFVSFTPPTTVISSITLPTAAQVSKSGNILTGWRNQGGTTFAPGQTATITSATTFTAQWAPVINVSFVLDGGAYVGGFTPPSEIAANLTLPTAAQVSKSGYSLTGWRNQNNEFFAQGQTITLTASATFTAQWDKIVAISRVRVNSWEAVAQGDIFVPTCLFDGNPATFWHARWSGGSGHTTGESLVDIDFGSLHTISRIEIDRRLISGQNIRSVRMFTHTEQGNVFPNGERIPANFPANVPQTDIDLDFAMTGWTELQNQDREITGLNTPNSVVLTLNTPITARYIRLGITNGTASAADFTQVREIRVFGESGGSTFIRNREILDNRFGILLENAIVSALARISVITPEPATVNMVILDNLGNVVFSADGVGAESARRTYGQVYSINLPQQNNNPIVWNLTNNNGRYVANGTYLILVEAIGISGRRFTYSARIGVNR
ncbi:MAG: S8 family serine peptidase [Chitinivibrionia bacterium]|nr:S8 family serine peptidase [Chitinivibrionia bacterium]